MTASTIVALAGQREQRRRGNLHRDVTRCVDQQRAVDGQEREPGRTEHDLIAGLEPMYGRRSAVYERPRLPGVVDPGQRSVAQLDVAVLARHRQIGELHQVALATADSSAAQRQLELATRIGALDHDEARQRHGGIVPLAPSNVRPWARWAASGRVAAVKWFAIALVLAACTGSHPTTPAAQGSGALYAKKVVVEWGLSPSDDKTKTDVFLQTNDDEGKPAQLPSRQL